MGAKRKQHGAEFKARVAMAALSGEKTLAALSAEFGVHATMISTWEQELVKRAGELFERGNKTAVADDAQKVIDDLHRKIGDRRMLVKRHAIGTITGSLFHADSHFRLIVRGAREWQCQFLEELTDSSCQALSHDAVQPPALSFPSGIEATLVPGLLPRYPM